MTIRLVRTLALIVVALVLVPGGPASGQDRSASLAAWLSAVREHQPGRWDAPAQAIGEMSSADLRDVFDALRAETGDTSSGHAILIAGAMLHTDIAILGSRRRIKPGPGDRFVSVSVDGRDFGQQPADPSWAFARRLIAALEPRPADNQLVRLWYRATTAHMARYSLLADVGPHLEQARKSFPDDPEMLLDTGCMYEALAGPKSQAVMADLVVPRGMRLRLVGPSVGEGLKRAEEFYSRVLRLDANHLEARVRRGRVRSLRGDHKDAIEDLRAAVDAAREPFLKYLALLFLGGAFERIDNIEQARAAYERAAALYGLAQSPHLALSRLATRRGDMPGAQREMQQLLRLSPTAPDRGDPWWSYDMGSGRRVDALFAQLRAAVAAARGPS